MDQTQVARRLILAIICQAIEDACRPPTPAEVKAKANRLRGPIQALRWLFAPNPVLVWYAGWVDLDVPVFREALIKAAHRYEDNYFRSDQRRILRMRLQWARRDGLLSQPYDPYVEDQDDDDEDSGPA